MERKIKSFLVSLVILLPILVGISLYWGSSINWGRYRETKEIWLPEKYILTNKVGNSYILSTSSPDLDKPSFETSLQDYKKTFSESMVAITTNGTIYYWVEKSLGMNKTTYWTSQDFPVDDPVYPESVTILSDKEIELQYYCPQNIGFAVFLAAICSIGGSIGVMKLIERKYDC
jgi:hypothetical protein